MFKKLYDTWMNIDLDADEQVEETNKIVKSYYSIHWFTKLLNYIVKSVLLIVWAPIWVIYCFIRSLTTKD